MLCLCYLSFVIGATDYTQAPIRLCKRVVVGGVKNESETVAVLDSATKTRREFDLYASPVNELLTSTTRFVSPRLKEYYKSLSGTLFAIEPQTGFRLLYIFTQDTFGSVFEMVHALNQQFLSLINELAAALDENTGIKADITPKVFNAVCAIVVPEEKTLPCPDTTTIVSPEKKQELDRAIIKDPEIPTLAENLKKLKKETQKTPPQDHFPKRERENPPEYLPKSKPAHTFVASEKEKTYSAPPPPSRSAPPPNVEASTAPKIDDGESEEEKELRQKAKDARRKAILEAQRGAFFAKEQTERQQFADESQQLLTALKQQELRETRHHLEALFDQGWERLTSEEQKTFDEILGTFSYDLFLLQWNEDKEKEAHKEQLKKEFEKRQAQARQDFVDQETEMRQSMEQAYSQFNQAIEEALHDWIRISDSEIQAHPERVLGMIDNWKLSYESFDEDQWEGRTRHEKICTSWSEKRFSSLKFSEPLFKYPTLVSGFVGFIYVENSRKTALAFEAIKAQIKAWKQELETHKIQWSSTEEADLKTMQIGPDIYQQLSLRDKKVLLDKQKEKLRDYWTHFDIPTNPYKKEIQKLATSNILRIGDVYDALKRSLEKLVANDYWNQNKQHDTTLQGISTYFGVPIEAHSTYLEFEQACKTAYRKKALLFHPDKNPQDPLTATRLMQENSTFYQKLTEQARQEYVRYFPLSV